jgi:hypothetical protein
VYILLTVPHVSMNYFMSNTVTGFLLPYGFYTTACMQLHTLQYTAHEHCVPPYTAFANHAYY